MVESIAVMEEVLTEEVEKAQSDSERSQQMMALSEAANNRREMYGQQLQRDLLIDYHDIGNWGNINPSPAEDLDD